MTKPAVDGGVIRRKHAGRDRLRQLAGPTIAAPLEDWPPQGAPWRGLAWSLSYAAFLWYIVVVTTYHFPDARVAMATALVGVLFGRDPLRFSALLGWLGAFIAWAAIAYPVTRFPEQVEETVTAMVKVWLITLVAMTVLNSRRRIRLFVIFFLACFALYPMRGALFNYYVASHSLVGRAVWNFIYENPNDLAVLALLQLSMAVGLLVTERKKGWVWMAALAGTVLLPVLILMTQSRGGFIALALFGFLLLAHWRRRGMVLIAAAVLIVGIVVLAPGGVWTRMAGLSRARSTTELEAVDPEGSAKARFEIWKVAAKVIRDQPVLGVGVGAYPMAHESYAIDEPIVRAAKGKRDTHNTWLNVLAETGVPGLILYLAMLITTVWKAERIRRACRVVLPRQTTQLLYLEFGLAAFLVAGIFGSLAHLLFLYIHLALIWSLADLCRREALPSGRAIAATRPIRG